MSPARNTDPRSQARRDVLSLAPDVLRSVLSERLAAEGQPAYRVAQIEHWIYASPVRSFAEMTNLPEGVRDALASSFQLREPELAKAAQSSDGTCKHLWQLHDGELIESVLIPDRSRLTLCISSQAGCAVGCTFCATGWAGFTRQLTAG